MQDIGLYDALVELIDKHHSDPWSSAPPWAIALNKKVDRLLEGQDKMSKQGDAVNGAVSGLVTAFGSLHDAVTKELVVIANKNQDDPDITQAVANINALTGKMAVDAAAVTAQLPDVTTVPPPAPSDPVVAVPPTVTVPTISTDPVPAPAPAAA